MRIIKYIVGDLNNGDLDAYNTQQGAMDAFKDAVDEGTTCNIEVIGEEGCQWKTEEEAREAAKDFFYVKKFTINYDKDKEVEWQETVYLIEPNNGVL